MNIILWAVFFIFHVIVSWMFYYVNDASHIHNPTDGDPSVYMPSLYDLESAYDFQRMGDDWIKQGYEPQKFDYVEKIIVPSSRYFCLRESISSMIASIESSGLLWPIGFLVNAAISFWLFLNCGFFPQGTLYTIIAIALTIVALFVITKIIRLVYNRSQIKINPFDIKAYRYSRNDDTEHFKRIVSEKAYKNISDIFKHEKYLTSVKKTIEGRYLANKVSSVCIFLGYIIIMCVVSLVG